MKIKDLDGLPGAKRLTPLDMNGIAILKSHTVITFDDPKPSGTTQVR